MRWKIHGTLLCVWLWAVRKRFFSCTSFVVVVVESLSSLLLLACLHTFLPISLCALLCSSCRLRCAVVNVRHLNRAVLRFFTWEADGKACSAVTFVGLFVWCRGVRWQVARSGKASQEPVCSNQCTSSQTDEWPCRGNGMHQEKSGMARRLCWFFLPSSLLSLSLS